MRRQARMPLPKHRRTVGLVVGEQRPCSSGMAGDEPAPPKSRGCRNLGVGTQQTVVSEEADGARGALITADYRLRLPLLPPTPCVAKPERRQHVQRCGLGSSVFNRDADGDLVVRPLRIFDQDVKKTVVLKDPGVDQFVLGAPAAAAAVFRDQLRIREGRLRIAVAERHEGVGRCIVDMKEILLHVLAVISLGRRQPEQSLLEVRITFIPEGRRETKALIPVADAGDTILTPAVGLSAGPVVGEICPGIAIGRVVLPDRTPRPVRQVGAPSPPAGGIIGTLADPTRLGIWCGLRHLCGHAVRQF